MMWWVVGAIFISSAYCSPLTDPIVSTNVGIIRGRHATDGNYAMYLGIPYARVDRNNPFADNIPQPPFSNFEIFDATDDSASCPQQNEFSLTIEGSLDCLSLNIYVPDGASPQNKLPVLVWIHGGGFEFGSKGKYNYGPKYLVKHNVIFVIINYRVGPYGFMCLDIPEVPGNQGLKDQQEALRWIKRNIAGFGGDPNNIAIAGNSAGAVSVDLQLRFNKDDTFHKVIIESGTAISDWAILEPDFQLPIKIASQFGFETNSSLDAVKFLATVEPLEVIAAGLKLGAVRSPCIEKEFDGVTRFIHDYPKNVHITKVKNTSILLGVTSDEMLVGYINRGSAFFETFDFKSSLKQSFDITKDELNQLADIVQRFYVGGDEISEKKYIEIGEFETDLRFIYPSKVSIDEYFANGATTIYQYLFSYSGNRNYNKVKSNITEVGAVHADELGYLFDVFYLEEPNKEDQLMIDRMTTLWTNFIKYGDPTPDGATDLVPVKWPKVTVESSSYLSIDSNYTVGERMFNDRMAFWDLIYLTYKTNRNNNI